MMSIRQEIYICPQCHTGKMQPKRTAYHIFLDGLLLTWPHFGAWVCDVCGYFEYDSHSLQRLHELINSRPLQTMSSRSQRKPAAARH